MPDPRRRLIVTDSLFSMDGDLAQLPELLALAQSHRAILVVDDARHGRVGAHGPRRVRVFRRRSRCSGALGTLSKALGSSGGFVVGRQSLVDWLYNRASHVFSTAQPAAVCTASLAALHVVREEPQRRIQLLQRAANLRETLRSQGWCVGASQSQIVPVMVGEPEHAVILAEQLREASILVPAVAPGRAARRVLAADQRDVAAHATDLQQLTDRLAELRGRCAAGSRDHRLSSAVAYIAEPDRAAR